MPSFLFKRETYLFLKLSTLSRPGPGRTIAKMASTTRSRLDKLYIAFFAISLVSMLGKLYTSAPYPSPKLTLLPAVDLVHFLPDSLWIPQDSPVHPLHSLREFYTTTYQDLYFLTPWASQPRFFRLFTLLELVFQLPAALWILRRFLSGKRGPALELMCIVYGVECALTTLTCIYDCWGWEGYAWEVQRVLIFQLYLPWFLIRKFPLPCLVVSVIADFCSCGDDGGHVHEAAGEVPGHGERQEGAVRVFALHLAQGRRKPSTAF